MNSKLYKDHAWLKFEALMISAIPNLMQIYKGGCSEYRNF